MSLGFIKKHHIRLEKHMAQSCQIIILMKKWLQDKWDIQMCSAPNSSIIETGRVWNERQRLSIRCQSSNISDYFSLKLRRYMSNLTTKQSKVIKAEPQKVSIFGAQRGIVYGFESHRLRSQTLVKSRFLAFQYSKSSQISSQTVF